MSHEPHSQAVENALALVLTGHRAAAVAWEEAWRRYFKAGLQRWAEATMTDGPTLDPATALTALTDCAKVEGIRYNEENNLTPASGTPTAKV